MKFPLKIFLLYISYNISLCVMKPNKTCIKPNPVKYANYNYTEAKPYSYLISNLTWCDESICGNKKNGVCISSTQCKCFFHYKQVKEYQSKNNGVELCNYYQYSQNQVIFYEVLFPGLGFFIIGKYFWGLFKMIFLPYVYSLWVKEEKTIWRWILMCMIGYTLLFLHFRDFYLLYNHKIRDRYNVSLFTKSKIANYTIHNRLRDM